MEVLILVGAVLSLLLTQDKGSDTVELVYIIILILSSLIFAVLMIIDIVLKCRKRSVVVNINEQTLQNLKAEDDPEGLMDFKKTAKSS